RQPPSPTLAVALGSRLEPVADTPRRDEAAWLGRIGLDLFAKAPDVNGHGRGITVEGEVPDFVEELRAREHSPRVRRHQVEDVELPRRKPDGPSPHANHTACTVHLEVAEGELLLPGPDVSLRLPPKHGLNARHDLARRERLRYIVVGTELE